MESIKNYKNLYVYSFLVDLLTIAHEPLDKYDFNYGEQNFENTIDSLKEVLDSKKIDIIISYYKNNKNYQKTAKELNISIDAVKIAVVNLMRILGTKKYIDCFFVDKNLIDNFNFLKDEYNQLNSEYIEKIKNLKGMLSEISDLKIPKVKEYIENLTLEDLDLNFADYNILKKNDIDSIGKLSAASIDDLYNFGLSDKQIENIKNKLFDIGLKLNENKSNI